MVSSFRCPDIEFGWGAIEGLGEIVRRFGSSALLCLGSKSAFESGLADRVKGILEDAGVVVHILGGIPPEPGLDYVDRGREALKESGAGVVVAIGGGSVIDVGKAIAGLAYESTPSRQYHGRTVETSGAPCIACPTTAGTGSEATPNGVFIDPRTLSKKSIRGAGLLPKVAVVDPELTLTLPPELTAYCGMDALTQAIESFVSRKATPLTRAISLEATTLLVDGLPRAFRDGSSREAREMCSWGSLMAGVALANARLGVVHGIAHPLGSRYHIPHGLVCGILLPWSICFNSEVVAEDYKIISTRCGKEILNFVQAFLKESGMLERWKEYAVGEENLEWIVAESLPSGSLKANPREVTEDDILWFVRQVSTERKGT